MLEFRVIVLLNNPPVKVYGAILAAVTCASLI